MRVKKIILTWLLVIAMGAALASPLFTLNAYADQQETETAGNSSTEDSSGNTVLENSRFRIKLHYGFNGQFRLGAAIPVSVALTAVKDDFKGTLRILIPGNTDYSTAAVSYEKAISLKKGVEKNTSLSVYDLSYITGLELQLEDEKGNISAEKLIKVNSNTGTSALTGVLCDDYDGLSYLDHCDINAGEYLDGTTLVELTKASFPEQASGLEALSYLIIDNYSSSQLSESQYEAVKEWVSDGGVLILGAGENGARTLAAFKEDMIEYTQGKKLAGSLQLKSTDTYIDSASDSSSEEAGDESNTTDQSVSDKAAGNVDSDSTAATDAGTAGSTATGGDADSSAVTTAGTAGSTATGGDADSSAVTTAGTAGSTVTGGDADSSAAADAGTAGSTVTGGDADSSAATAAGTAGSTATGGDAELRVDGVASADSTAAAAVSYIKIDQTPCNYTEKDSVYALKLEDAEPLEDIFTEGSLVWNKDYGKGHIVLTAFDLSSGFMKEWKNNATFATILLSKAASGYSAERLESLNYYEYSDHNEEMNALYHMIDIGTPDMNRLMIILGVFVVLVGFVFYLILRLIDKRGAMWVLVPLAAVICCGAILYVTAGIRIEHPVTASLTENYYDEEQKEGQTNVNLLCVVPGTEENQFQLSGKLSDLQIYQSAKSSSLLPDTESTDSENYDANTAVSESKEGYEITIKNDRTFEATLFSMKSDSETGKERLKLKAERTLDGISGTVTNDTKYDMKCVSVYVKGIEVPIGDMKSGEKVSFTTAENREMNAEFQQLEMPGVNMGTEEYDRVERIWDIFYERYLSDMDAMSVYTFGYIENAGENYVSNGEVSEENTGMMVCHDSLGLKEYEGAQMIDIYEYLGDHENGFTDDGSQILAAAETKCTFNIPVSDVRYLIRNDIIQAGSSSDNTKVYAFNGQTGQYEELFKKENSEKFKKDCPYIAEDGSISLKFVCTNPGYECAPDLTIVGGED